MARTAEHPPSLIPRRRLGPWTTWGIVALAAVAAAGLAPWLIGPECPQHLVIATGSRQGAYFAFALQYREILARDGIELEVRETSGSVENCRLLETPGSGVSLAFIQGGTVPEKSKSRLQSLASLYHEPVWVFYRGEKTLTRLSDLKGGRIAIGPEGSGTRAVALLLLTENGVTPDDGQTTLHEAGGETAAEALKDGRIDALFAVVSPRAPLIADLLGIEGVRLMDCRRAPAYARRHPFLSPVTLREGMVDLHRNLPATDMTLVAPTANLVSRTDQHPALIPLLLKAAQEVHRGGGLLDQPGEFPSALNVDCPLNPDARRYLKAGPSMLYRYLPFSFAAGIDRVKLMLLPLCTLLLPLLKVAPPVYRWRIRYRIFRWYRVLREIDQKMKQADADADFSDDITHLRTLETELAEVSVPLSYMEEFYNLRLHVAFVRQQLQRRQSDEWTASRAAA